MLYYYYYYLCILPRFGKWINFEYLFLSLVPKELMLYVWYVPAVVQSIEIFKKINILEFVESLLKVSG